MTRITDEDWIRAKAPLDLMPGGGAYVRVAGRWHREYLPETEAMLARHGTTIDRDEGDMICMWCESVVSTLSKANLTSCP